MAGFLEDIHGDGSFGSDWQHRDIGNCKVYNNDSRDSISDFVPPAGDSAWTFFCEIDTTESSTSASYGILSNLLISNSIPLPGLFAIVLDNLVPRISIKNAPGANGMTIKSSIPLALKRNNFTIVKEAPKDANSLKFFLNGIEVAKIIERNEPTSGTNTGNIYNMTLGTRTGGNQLKGNLVKLSMVNYVQSDLEITRDAGLGYQNANNPNQFLLNIDFDKNTGDNLTDTSPNNYTITSVGNKNFTNFYS